MLKFGGPDAMLGGLKISGNIGLRYVETKDLSTGSVRYADGPGRSHALPANSACAWRSHR